jgi:hypothetical protein
MRMKWLSSALVMIVAILFATPTQGATTASVDIDLTPYGFKAVSHKDVIGGIFSRPQCLFLDTDHVVVVAKRRLPIQGLVKRDEPNSGRVHYVGVLINLRAGKVVNIIDLGGADYYGDGEVLDDGTLIFYRHGLVDFWRLVDGELLQRKLTVPIDVSEIDAALKAKSQFERFGLYPSHSHKVLYLSLDASISGVTQLWTITTDGVRPFGRQISPLFLGETVESDNSVIALRRFDECRFFAVPNEADKPIREIYHGDSCQHLYAPSFIGPGELVIGSTIKGQPAEFRMTDGSLAPSLSGRISGNVTAAWNGSAYMALELRSSGGSEFFDISSHISEAIVHVYDHDWHEIYGLEIPIRGADFSGPFLSPTGTRIVEYNSGHFYSWNVRTVAG